jgi:hypothetical protein
MMGSSVTSLQVMWDLKMLIHQVSIGFIGEGRVLRLLPTKAHPLEMWDPLHFPKDLL